MTLLRTPEASALCGADHHRLGYVPHYTRVFAPGPAIYAAWTQLVTALWAGMDERRDELVRHAAARRLRARYCVLAHATVLQSTFLDTDSLLAIAVDRHGSDLDPLRAHLSNMEIFHVVAAVAACRFCTAVLDATHTTTDDSYDALDPTPRAALLQPCNGGHHDQ
ncbi:hypothetical protein [Rugosimonospora africana]|uniref:Carboxymuconolactone decarboxylase-like domain-containing protein n=1 Tax=Rugosimonospora africana TaxID=556532 RepID=A0A8J3VW27_9ACTN|nr:hypothetical protein [Rugosimonospora africana]GIH20529.1 hypothetical protein Raf01_87010 [Rugosimonospora africana]